jgi:thiosulfate dehydrogenase
MSRRPIGLFLGVALGFALFPTMFYLYLWSGLAPVKASASPLPLEHLFAKTGLHAQMDKEFPKSVPIVSDLNAWTAGAAIYRDNCSVCHGVPNRPETAIGAGMFPRAPQLFAGRDMVTDDPPGETFWKAKNGIRLTGMPGFSSSLTDEQLWQVSVMLASADKLPASVVQIISAEPIPATASSVK